MEIPAFLRLYLHGIYQGMGCPRRTPRHWRITRGWEHLTCPQSPYQSKFQKSEVCKIN